MMAAPIDTLMMAALVVLSFGLVRCSSESAQSPSVECTSPFLCHHLKGFGWFAGYSPAGGNTDLT